MPTEVTLRVVGKHLTKSFQFSDFPAYIPTAWTLILVVATYL